MHLTEVSNTAADLGLQVLTDRIPIYIFLVRPGHPSNVCRRAHQCDFRDNGSAIIAAPKTKLATCPATAPAECTNKELKQNASKQHLEILKLHTEIKKAMQSHMWALRVDRRND